MQITDARDENLAGYSLKASIRAVDFRGIALSPSQKNHSFQSITFMICLGDAKRRNKGQTL